MYYFLLGTNVKGLEEELHFLFLIFYKAMSQIAESKCWAFKSLSSVHHPKTFPEPSLLPPSPRLPNRKSGLTLFTFSRILYKWSNELCTLFLLAFLTEHSDFEIQPRLSMYWKFSLLLLSNFPLYGHHLLMGVGLFPGFG